MGNYNKISSSIFFLCSGVSYFHLVAGSCPHPCTNTAIPSTELSPTPLGAQSDENVCFVLNMDSSKMQQTVNISLEVPYLLCCDCH